MALIENPERQVMNWKFTQLDENRDNQLNAKELRQLQKLIKRFVNPRSCAKMFRATCDYDKDRLITRREWSLCLGMDLSSKFLKFLKNFLKNFLIFLLNLKKNFILFFPVLSQMFLSLNSTDSQPQPNLNDVEIDETEDEIDDKDENDHDFRATPAPPPPPSLASQGGMLGGTGYIK